MIRIVKLPWGSYRIGCFRTTLSKSGFQQLLIPSMEATHQKGNPQSIFLPSRCGVRPIINRDTLLTPHPHIKIYVSRPGMPRTKSTNVTIQY